MNKTRVLIGLGLLALLIGARVYMSMTTSSPPPAKLPTIANGVQNYFDNIESIVADKNSTTINALADQRDLGIAFAATTLYLEFEDDSYVRLALSNSLSDAQMDFVLARFSLNNPEIQLDESSKGLNSECGTAKEVSGFIKDIRFSSSHPKIQLFCPQQGTCTLAEQAPAQAQPIARFLDRIWKVKTCPAEQAQTGVLKIKHAYIGAS